MADPETIYNWRRLDDRITTSGQDEITTAEIADTRPHRDLCDTAAMARVRISIVFESGARIGPGKIALLESIRDTGSISAAARNMGMDYKRAWTLLDSVNQAFTEPVVTATPGGPGGGGAVLTVFGAEVLERYRRIQEQAEKMASDDLAPLKRRARPDAGPKV